MKRGEIYFANLDPTIGSEIRKKRPVLIVSNDANNRTNSLITIIPLTSNTKKIFPFETFIEKKNSGLKKDSKAQCHQIRTISKSRITTKKVGSINKTIMEKIEHSIRLHLDIY